MTDEEFKALPIGTRIYFSVSRGPVFATKKTGFHVVYDADQVESYKDLRGKVANWHDLAWSRRALAFVREPGDTDPAIPAPTLTLPPLEAPPPTRPAHWPWETAQEKRHYFYGKEKQ